MTSVEQQCLNDLDRKLWTAADRLRSALDAAVYKRVALGLIFLKHVIVQELVVSDALPRRVSLGELALSSSAPVDAQA